MLSLHPARTLGASPLSRRIDILVVDDRTVDADVTLYALRRSAPQARVLRLRSGDEALQYLFAVGAFFDRSPGLPHLVFLDVDMPVMSGLSVLQVIRAHPLTQAIPVAMLNSDGAHVAGHDMSGAQAYLLKPLDLEKYCAEVADVLAQWLQPNERDRQ